MKELNIYKIEFENMKGQNEEIFVIARSKEEAKEDMFEFHFWYDDEKMEFAYKKFINVTLVKNPTECEIENAKHWTIAFAHFATEQEEYYYKLKNEKNK